MPEAGTRQEPSPGGRRQTGESCQMMLPRLRAAPEAGWQMTETFCPEPNKKEGKKGRRKANLDEIRSRMRIPRLSRYAFRSPFFRLQRLTSRRSLLLRGAAVVEGARDTLLGDGDDGGENRVHFAAEKTEIE